ncbi:hypothetical protein ACFSUI_22995 [Ralstonia solanacearum]
MAPEFYTEQEITATRGTLAALYSIDPQADLYADHGAVATTGFTVFDAMVPVPHRLYLGHGELFKFTDSAQIDLSFDFANAGAGHASNARRPLLLDWEYLSTDGWQPLTLVDDSTERFTVDGKITLAKFFGPDSKVDSIGGHDSCWIRGTVSSRTPHARIAVEPAGYLVQFTPNGAQPVSAGKEVHVKGQSVKSTVLEVVGGRLILAAPLTGAAANAELRTDVAAIGTVLSAPPAFRIAVESTRDLMPGDVVTLDGAARATILQTDGTSLYLSAALAGAQPGLTVELADALPPLRPDGADADGALPQVDVIRARVGFGKSGLALDSAYVDDASLDISKDFSPSASSRPVLPASMPPARRPSRAMALRSNWLSRSTRPAAAVPRSSQSSSTARTGSRSGPARTIWTTPTRSRFRSPPIRCFRIRKSASPCLPAGQKPRSTVTRAAGCVCVLPRATMATRFLLT